MGYGSPLIRSESDPFTGLHQMHVLSLHVLHASPAVNEPRRMAFSFCSTMSPLSVKRAKKARLKRLEIRRLKSLCQTKSDFAGDARETSSLDDRCFKKIRLENKESADFSEKQALVMSLSFSSSLASSSSGHSSERDPIRARNSSFRDEARKERGDSLNVTRFSHGSISVIGRRREMEDAVTTELGFLTRDSRKYDFFAVYDGHGGSRVAHACRARLHWLLLQEMEEMKAGSTKSAMVVAGEVDWEKVMVASFGKMDEEVNDSGKVGAQSGTSSVTIGSTAVVVVVGEEELVVANCGDSRAVLSRGGVAVPMSNDHKPDRPDELERIEVAGGRVINWNGQRVLGVLATSRSIGDHYLKPFVISEPEVTVSERTDADEFLILASDGLWDVISNEVACEIARRCLNGRMRRKSQELVDGRKSSEIVNKSRAAEAAATLAEFAMARGSRDNISVVVVELKKGTTSV
uniref:protein-serine/threonine phosphatase n=1 Tax=Davidia involucrata TaxID=16924 RepID=A0A5B7B3I4_DAVIN